MVHKPDQERTAGSWTKIVSSQTKPAESAGKKLTATMAHRASGKDGMARPREYRRAMRRVAFQ